MADNIGILCKKIVGWHTFMSVSAFILVFVLPNLKLLFCVQTTDCNFGRSWVEFHVFQNVVDFVPIWTIFCTKIRSKMNAKSIFTQFLFWHILKEKNREKIWRKNDKKNREKNMKEWRIKWQKWKKSWKNDTFPI